MTTAQSPPKSFSWFRLAGMLLSLGIFGVSLTGSGYAVGDPANPQSWTSCFALLLLGWLGVFQGILAWLANPTLFAAWAFSLTKFRWVTLALSVTAALMALTFLLQREMPINEAGHVGPVTALGQGYWIWISSMLLLSVWTLIDSIIDP